MLMAVTTQKRKTHSPGRRNAPAKLSKRELSALLESYDLGSIVKISLLSKHSHFAIYQIDTDIDSFIGYSYDRKNSPLTSFTEEVFTFLQYTDLPIPSLILSAETSSGKFMLWDRCVGRSVTYWNEKQCRSVGIAAALLHTKSIEFSSNTFKPPLLLQIKERFTKIFHTLETHFYPLAEEIEEIERLWPYRLPHGLIHSDIWEKNVLFAKNHVSAFLDPHAYQVDLFVCDIAGVAKQLYFSSPTENADSLFSSFLEGYSSIRPLSDEECEAITPALRLKIFLTILIMLEKAAVNPLQKELYLNNAVLNFMKLGEAKNISFQKS